MVAGERCEQRRIPPRGGEGSLRVCPPACGARPPRATRMGRMQAARRPTRLPPLPAPRPSSCFAAAAVCAHQTIRTLRECGLPSCLGLVPCRKTDVRVLIAAARSLSNGVCCCFSTCAKGHTTVCERSQSIAGVSHSLQPSSDGGRDVTDAVGCSRAGAFFGSGRGGRGGAAARCVAD